MGKKETGKARGREKKRTGGCVPLLLLLHRFAKSVARATAISSGVGLLASMFCIARRASRYAWKVDGKTPMTSTLSDRFKRSSKCCFIEACWGSLSALNMSTIIASAKWSRTTNDDSIPRDGDGD